MTTEKPKKSEKSGRQADLGPHISRNNRGVTAPWDRMAVVLPVYDPRHTLHHVARMERYRDDHPKLLELINNLDHTKFQVHPGIARKNGTWSQHGGCPLPPSIQEADGCDGDCPIIEMAPGNRRYKAIFTLGRLWSDAGIAPDALLGYTMVVRAMTDGAMGQLLASENNFSMRQSRIEQIRQGMLFRDASENQIRSCFSAEDFGKKVDPVNVIRVLAECEEPIWEAYAAKQIGLGEAEAIGKKARKDQVAFLAEVIAAHQTLAAARVAAPKPKLLKPESRQKLIALLEDLLAGRFSESSGDEKPTPDYAQALLDELKG